MRKHKFTRALVALALGVGTLTAVGVGAAGPASAAACGTTGDYFNNYTATGYGGGGVGPLPPAQGISTTGMIAHTPTLCIGGTGTFAGNLIMIQNPAGGVMKLGQMFQPGSNSCNRIWWQALEKTGATLVTRAPGSLGGCLTNNTWHSMSIQVDYSTGKFNFIVDGLVWYQTTFTYFVNWVGNARLRFGTEASYLTSNVGGSAANPGIIDQISNVRDIFGTLDPASSDFSFAHSPDANPGYWKSGFSTVYNNAEYWSDPVQ